MTAETPARRKRTAREAARQWGYSERHIRRIVAEPRDEYLSRAQQRRKKIRELRATGMTMRGIAAEIGCSIGTVHNALKGVAEDLFLSTGQGGQVGGHAHGHS